MHPAAFASNILALCRKCVTPLFLCAAVFGAVRAHADAAGVIPEVSYLERWAAFSLGRGNGFSLVSGGFHVTGDLGQAGNGKLLMAGDSLIDGDLYDRSNGGVLKLGNTMVTGSTFYDQDAVLDESVDQAIAASDRAFGLMPNRSNTSANLDGNENLTITGAPGETVVLNLKNFVLCGESSFTLQGTATTNFIINVRRRFALKGNARVYLAGLLWNQVLFNIVGPGHKVSLGDNTDFTGILMANSRTIEARGAPPFSV